MFKRLVTLVAAVPVVAFAAESVVPPIPTVPPLPVAASAAAAGVVDPFGIVASISRPMVQKSKGSSVDLRFATVSYVVDFVYENMVHTPHVIEPAVLADQRQVSFRYSAGTGDLRSFLSNFLESLGYGVKTLNGVDFIGKQSKADDHRSEEREPFVYLPKYRRADYLMRMVQPLVGGRFTSQRGLSVVANGGDGTVSHSVPQNSAASLIDQTSDQLVFLGTASEVLALKKVLPMIDTARRRVNLRAWVYEVTNSGNNQSGFSLAVSILGGALGLGVNNGLTDSTSSVLQLRAGSSVELAIQALDSDSRFRALTRPNLTVLSGERARLNVGQQVPTQGNVTYQGVSGTPVASVVYQDAGVIFDVEPTVMDDMIEISLQEEISDFVRTSTGVNSSPTKNTRKLQTVTSMRGGDIAVVGGLIQSHESASSSGLSFLPRWANGHSDSRDRTEVVLVLEVNEI
ncbi:type II secretory pathway protein [Caballeronia zhejiangensis]|nr:type II secretory pathway protein [Caballeronia zhejiangensis]